LHLLLAHHLLLTGLLSGQRVKLDQLAAAESHGFETGEFLFYEGVGNSFRMELLFEIGGDSQPVDFLDFFPRWSEAGSVQEVNDLLLLG
jgi:hypothetical protein